MSRMTILTLAVALVLGLAWLWHGPLGTGERLAASIELGARAQLDRDEMTQVMAHVERRPLVRKIILSGPADDFQRREIKRRLEALPGVGEAEWSIASKEVEAAR
jgi:hypothetical protein